jgi:hypothetical protein
MANEKRLIDANALKDSLKKWLSDAEVLCNTYVYNAIEDCIYEVDTMPTVDAVEVVRCKDCYWRNRNYCMHPTDGMNVTQDDDFCSYGERREGK